MASLTSRLFVTGFVCFLTAQSEPSSGITDRLLILNVPFNNETDLRDRVCNLDPFTTGKPEAVDTGPFGDNSTSVSSNGSSISGYRFLPLKSGITICFYFYQSFNESTGNLSESGIFHVKFVENSTYITVWADSDGYIQLRVYLNGMLLDRSLIPSSFNDWGFNCFAYNRVRLFTSYYHLTPDNFYTGRGFDELSSPFEPNYLAVEILVGEALMDDGRQIFMSRGNAIACLSVYSAVIEEMLQMDQIRTLTRNCEISRLNLARLNSSESCAKRPNSPKMVIRTHRPDSVVSSAISSQTTMRLIALSTLIVFWFGKKYL